MKLTLMFACVGFAILCGGLPARGQDKKPVEPTEEQLKAAKEGFGKLGAKYEAVTDPLTKRTQHWFQMPKRHAPGAPQPPPRWKMAMITWLAIFPLINVLNLVLAPLLGGLPAIVRTLVSTAILVPLMTWVVMPAMTRLFLRWLFPKIT